MIIAMQTTRIAPSIHANYISHYSQPTIDASTCLQLPLSASLLALLTYFFPIDDGQVLTEDDT